MINRYDESLYDFGDAVQQGWQCPKCNFILSPISTICPHCTPIVKEGTDDKREYLRED